MQKARPVSVNEAVVRTAVKAESDPAKKAFVTLAMKRKNRSKSAEDGAIALASR
jgi:hypothetical protein